jgi:hypothetical protein
MTTVVAEKFVTKDKKVKTRQEAAPKKPGVTIGIDQIPNGEWKALGGSDRGQWNERLSTLVTTALPVNQGNAEVLSAAASAVAAGVVDMKPTDPIEGVLISQIVTANEAALEFYHRGCTNTAAGYFDAGTKYLQLADKSSRTVALLTERLDQHRGRGQQQITVKHVTVNADQAVVTDQIVSDNRKETVTSNLLTAGTGRSMEIIQPTQKEAVSEEGEGRKRNEHQPHAQGSRGPAVHGPIKTDWPALPCACGAWMASLPNARRTRRRA